MRLSKTLSLRPCLVLEDPHRGWRLNSLSGLTIAREIFAASTKPFRNHARSPCQGKSLDLVGTPASSTRLSLGGQERSRAPLHAKVQSTFQLSVNEPQNKFWPNSPSHPSNYCPPITCAKFLTALHPLISPPPSSARQEQPNPSPLTKPISAFTIPLFCNAS